MKIRQATKNGWTEVKIGGVFDATYPNSTTRRGRVQEEGTICPTIATKGELLKLESNMRIRKLTPKECYRLMNFTDADYEKASSKVSQSQLYKQAGNSIVVNCLVAIMGQMFEGHEEDYKKPMRW